MVPHKAVLELLNMSTGFLVGQHLVVLKCIQDRALSAKILCCGYTSHKAAQIVGLTQSSSPS